MWSIKYPKMSVLFPTNKSQDPPQGWLEGSIRSPISGKRSKKNITETPEAICNDSVSLFLEMCAIFHINSLFLHLSPFRIWIPAQLPPPGLFLTYWASAAKQMQCQGNNVFLHPFKTHQVCTYRASIQESGFNFKLNQLSPTNSKHLAQLSEWGFRAEHAPHVSQIQQE